MKRNSKILINGRFIRQRLTGVQRYASEVIRHFGPRIQLIVPPLNPRFSRLPIWEQFFLPFSIKSNDLLWSPTNTGPLVVSNQVVTVHDLSTLDHPEWFSHRFSTWYRFLLPKLAQRVRKIITDSQFSKSRIVDLLEIHEERVIVIKGGVGESFYPIPKERTRKILLKYGINEAYFLYVGSLEPRKNLPRLLQAWERVAIDIPDLELVVAGESSYPFREVDLSERNQRVRFLGRVIDADLPALYSGALAFVYPSIYEGFGLPPLEAMACGTPVITSNTTSLPEVVGDAGLLFNPYNVDEIAATIREIISNENLRQELRQKGMARASQFSWETTAQRVWEVLCHAAEES